MPQLKPETISMTGLNLFQHLCNLARLATSALDNASSCEVSRLGLQPPLLPGIQNCSCKQSVLASRFS